jgi:hypothetical protein
MVRRAIAGAVGGTAGLLFLAGAAAPQAAWAGPVFEATLSGDAERPTPNDSDGFGTGTGELTGEPGSFIFTYEVVYGNLTGPAGLGHIHHAVNPPEETDPLERFGPIIHDFPQLTSPIQGEWRFDDPDQPLTDAFAEALLDGELYFNLHTDQFPAGEIRGQILRTDDGGTVIPLPPPALAGLVGLATAAAAMARRKGSRR